MENVVLVIRTKLREQACWVPAEGLNRPMLVKGMQTGNTLNGATAYK